MPCPLTTQFKYTCMTFRPLSLLKGSALTQNPITFLPYPQDQFQVISFLVLLGVSKFLQILWSIKDFSCDRVCVFIFDIDSCVFFSLTLHKFCTVYYFVYIVFQCSLFRRCLCVFFFLITQTFFDVFSWGFCGNFRCLNSCFLLL